MHHFMVPYNTISLFLPEVCETIYQFYKVEQLKFPTIPQDAQTLNICYLKQSIIDETIRFLDEDPLSEDDRDLPYFILADDAFALRIYLMNPFLERNLNYEECIFNYRLSRARRLVKNPFGILANFFKWSTYIRNFLILLGFRINIENDKGHVNRKGKIGQEKCLDRSLICRCTNI